MIVSFTRLAPAPYNLAKTTCPYRLFVVSPSFDVSIAVDHRSRWPAHVYATALTLTLTLTLTLWSDPHTLQICQFLGSFHFI